MQISSIVRSLRRSVRAEAQINTMYYQEQLLDLLAPYGLSPLPASISVLITLLWLTIFWGWLFVPEGGRTLSRPGPKLLKHRGLLTRVKDIVTYYRPREVMLTDVPTFPPNVSLIRFLKHSKKFDPPVKRAQLMMINQDRGLRNKLIIRFRLKND